MWKRLGEVLASLRNAYVLLSLTGTAVTAFFLWWADETGPKVQIVLLPLLVTVLVIATLIWRKKRRFQGQIVTEGSASQERIEWCYRPVVRRIAVLFLVLSALLTVVDVLWIAQLLLHPTKSVLVVADFEGPQPASYRVTETLIENLKIATRSYPDIRVVAASKPIRSSSEARLLGMWKASSVIIWGWYGATPTNVQLHVNFELLSKPVKRYFRSEGYTTTAPLAEMNSFELQARFSKEMSCVYLIAVGLAKYEGGDYDRAVARLTDAIKLNTSPPEIIDPNMMYFMRGLALFKKGDDLSAAISDYTLIIKAKPEYVDAYTNRGACYLKRGMFSEGIADLDRALQLRPGSAQAFFNRGVAYAMSGSEDRAIADLSKAIELSPQDPLGYYERAVAYRTKGDPKTALIDFGKAIELDPRSADAYYERGMTRLISGNPEKAIGDFSKALALAPDRASAFHNRGWCYASLGRHQEAVADFTKAIKLHVTPLSLSFNERGVSYHRLGRLSRAISDFTSALAADSKMSAAYYNRGNAYLAKGDLDSAGRDFEDTITSNAYYAAGYLGRGMILHKKKQFYAAVQAYSRALELDPALAGACFQRGVAYVDLGNLPAAKQDLLRALSLPSDPETRLKVIQELNYIGVRP